MNEQPSTFLDLKKGMPALAGGGIRKVLVSCLESILGFKKVRELFITAASSSDEKTHVTNRTLQLFDIALDAENAVDMIPREGGAIVIANHPFGGADAIALCNLCCQNRNNDDEVKILANSIVYHAPKYSKFLLPLKIMQEENAQRHNLKTLKSATELVRDGGLLGVFPAGAVSRYRKDLGFSFADAEWSKHIARIALKTKAPVIPIRFFGESPRWFNLIGVVIPLLRAALIPKLLLKMRGQTIRCRAGKVILHDELSKAEDPTALLRNAVYQIKL